MFCEQCGTKNEDGTAFCSECGARLEGTVAVTSTEAAEMTEVAAVVQPTDVTVQETAAVVDAQNGSAMNKLPKVNKKLITGIAIGAACLVAVVVLGTVASKTIFKGKNSFTDHPVIYAKDGDLVYRRTYKKDAIELTKDIPDDTPMYAYEMTNYVQTTEDGKMIFFLDDMDDEGGKLHYRKTSETKIKGKNAGENGYEIASNVTSFTVIPDGSGVLYLKNGEKLCYYNMKEEISIAGDVTSFDITEDYKKIVYKKSDGDLYVMTVGKKDDSEKIDSKIGYVEEVTEKGVYYSKEENLYYAEFGKDKEKVISDFSSIISDEDVMFVVTTGEKKTSFEDLFDDDCASEDAAITYPSYDDFRIADPSYWGGYRTDYEAYNDAYDKYSEKLQRDQVREYYKENEQTVTTYAVHKLDGAKATKIDEGFVGWYGGRMFNKPGESDSSKIKMSTITSYYDAQDKVSEMDSSGGEAEVSYLLNSGKMLSLGDIEYSDYTVSEDEKYMYIVEDANDEGYGTLNRYKIKGEELDSGSKEKIAEDVSIVVTEFEDGSILINGEESTGLYDGKYEEVSEDDISVKGYIDGTLYYTNEDEDFVKFKNGKNETIDTDVYDVDIRDKNVFYYIKDYSDSKYKGDLYVNKNGKKEKIDEDVSVMYKPSMYFSE